jgi:hypothetical protein
MAKRYGVVSTQTGLTLTGVKFSSIKESEEAEYVTSHNAVGKIDGETKKQTIKKLSAEMEWDTGLTRPATGDTITVNTVVYTLDNVESEEKSDGYMTLSISGHYNVV